MFQFKSLFGLLKTCPNEQKCIEYLEKVIWKGKIPTSPFDPASIVYPCAKNRYRCKNTGKYFTAKSTTIFRNSKIPLKTWFYALYKLAINKKGISSHQLAKDAGITQKSAWFVLQRLRYTFQSPIFETMLDGLIEIDETFVGGKNKNRHWNKKVPNSQGRSWKDKVPVLGIIERNGNLITQIIPNTQQQTIEPIIKEKVKEESSIYTDEWFAYKDLNKWFNHQIVNHRIKQYVNGNASTNSIESAWACLKRSIYGIYHQVSKEHLPKYIDEFTLRFNTRKYKVQETYDLGLLSSVGKSLSYRELISISPNNLT